MKSSSLTEVVLIFTRQFARFRAHVHYRLTTVRLSRIPLIAVAALWFQGNIGFAVAQIRAASTDATGERRSLQSPDKTGARPEYVLERGDSVDVTFRFTPEFNDEVVIGPDGHASFKAAGDLEAAASPCQSSSGESSSNRSGSWSIRR